MIRAERADKIIEKLAVVYPNAHCELIHRNAYELLVATILSAQCTDKRVNMVTPDLFAAYPDVASLAAARQPEVENLIRTTGFFRNKAKNMIAASKAIVDQHDGDVPQSMDALASLPGVGRKTANVVLGNAFGINTGVVVDTHVGRLSLRLGLTRHKDPVKCERDLMKVIPQHLWTIFSHWLIWHGRNRCKAVTPDCTHCELFELCPSGNRILKERAAKKRVSAKKQRSTISS